MTEAYRYPHFEAKNLWSRLSLADTPEPGDWMPSFELQATDGSWFRREELIGVKPALVMFASITDEATAGALPELRQLHERFGDRVDFITVYVRESHPGDIYRQPDTIDRKQAHAEAFQRQFEIPWRVVIDDIEGHFHRAMGCRESSAFVMDKNGVIIFRCLLGGRLSSIRAALEAATKNEHIRAEDRARLLPALRALGALDQTLELAGPDARRDARRQVLPVYVLGKIARIAQPLSPLARGLFALGVGALTITALGLGLRKLARR
ncbi:redoxin domain-containing protein [Myxococcota bacterium]|nr:redoxin domain-containing protein [Myxococcota bacterium]